MSKLNLFKLFGGKSAHAPWIISHFPAGYENLTYIEPFAGALNIALQKRPSIKEIINDFHYPTHCVHLSAQNGELEKAVRYLPYTEAVFDYFLSFQPSSILDHAVREYVLHRMSRGGMKKNFAWSDRLRGGKPGDVNAWENAVKNLPTIRHMVRHCILTCDDGINLLKMYGSNPDVFWYLDPPYLSDTRTSKAVYDLEFTDKQHEQLLSALLNCKGKWLLSGYSSKLYCDKLGLPAAQKSVKLSSSQKKTKSSKTEALWKNY